VKKYSLIARTDIERRCDFLGTEAFDVAQSDHGLLGRRKLRYRIAYPLYGLAVRSRSSARLAVAPPSQRPVWIVWRQEAVERTSGSSSPSARRRAAGVFRAVPGSWRGW